MTDVETLENLYKDTPYSDEEVNRYHKLQATSNCLNIIKISSVVLFLVVLLFTFSQAYTEYKRPSLVYATLAPFYAVILGFVCHTFLAWFLHKLAYCLIRRHVPFSGSVLTSRPKGFSGGLCFLFSSDYFYALAYKQLMKDSVKNACLGAPPTCACATSSDHYENDGICLAGWDQIKNARKFFVEFSNWLNVIFTILLSFVAVIFLWTNQGWIVDVFFYTICWRILSRSIEIAVAYYKDVVRVDAVIFTQKGGATNKLYVNNWKSSLIRRPARISLAIHTLLEMILAFALLHYFLAVHFQPDSPLPLTNGQEELLDYGSFFLFSVSLSFFNFSFTAYPALIWSIVHVWQVLLSMVLIILSLANYLGMDDTLLQRDRKFFLDVEHLESARKNAQQPQP